MFKLRQVMLLLTLALSALLTTSHSYAWQTAQPPVEQEQDAEQENDADDGAEQTTEESTGEQAASNLPDIDNQAIQPGSGGPGRFIPSEQISQDLGVSFPVDI